MKVYNNIFQQIISAKNLFSAWDAFASDKQKKRDVQEFKRNLEGRMFKLCRELYGKIYQHSPYTSFYINDPKRRHIHKASIRDRVLHHAIFNVVNPIFEETFIATSFSCRVGFGTHKGVEALANMVRKVSGNGTRQCFILKCDVRKFFNSVRHERLLAILKQRIGDDNAMWLLAQIIDSFCVECYSRKRERERESSRVRSPRASAWEPHLPAFREHLYERV